MLLYSISQNKYWPNLDTMPSKSISSSTSVLSKIILIRKEETLIGDSVNCNTLYLDLYTTFYFSPVVKSFKNTKQIMEYSATMHLTFAQNLKATIRCRKEGVGRSLCPYINTTENNSLLTKKSLHFLSNLKSE